MTSRFPYLLSYMGKIWYKMSAHSNVAEHLLVSRKWAYGGSSFHYRSKLNYIYAYRAKPRFESKERLGKVCASKSLLMTAII